MDDQLASGEKRLKARARVRPIRIAFLISKNTSHHLLDAVMDFAHSIWAGRFSPIALVDDGLINAAYWPWLKAFDADVICTCTKLNSAERLRLIFELDPAQIVELEPDDGVRVADILEALEITPLSSLSTLAIKRERFLGPASEAKIFDVWDAGEVSRSLIDSFGSYSHSFSNYPFPEKFSEYAKTLTLTSEEKHTDRRRQPKASGEVVFSQPDAWSSMLKRGIACLSTLSAYRSPRPELQRFQISDYFQIIIGDAVEDRALHWNVGQFFPKWRDGELTSLRITAAELENDQTLNAVREYVQRHNRISQQNNSSSYVAIRSTSVNEEVLNEIANKLRSSRAWAHIKVHKHESASEILPGGDEFDRLQFDQPNLGRTLSNWEEFTWDGSTFWPPEMAPQHLTEAPDRSIFSSGQYAIDFAFDRRRDHSPYSNVRHIWRFSRRFRMANSVRIESKDRGAIRDILIPLRRVERYGLITTFASVQRPIQSVSMPSDDQAFYQAFVLEGYRYPKDFQPEVARAPALRFERSDKGDYLKGITGLFGDLHDAAEFVTHAFWSLQLDRWGANAKPADDATEQIFSKLKRKLAGRSISSDTELKNIAQIAAGYARSHRAPWNVIRYSRLSSSWNEYRESFWNQYRKDHPSDPHQSVSDYKEAEIHERRTFHEAVHALVAKGVLFQGLTSSCSNCRHSNWLPVANLATVLKCQICQATMPVPLEVDWDFKLNPFILECLREHGMQAVLWALNICRRRSNSSFFYQEPSDIWFTNPDAKCDTDVDISAIIDGRAYIIEVKSSKLNFGKPGQRDFIELVKKLRPNVAVAAVMDNYTPRQLESVIDALEQELDDASIVVEVWTLDTHPLSDSPYL